MNLLVTILALAASSAPAFAATTAVELKLNQPLHMQSCDGDVLALPNSAGGVNVTFVNVRQCSRFEVLGANGLDINVAPIRLTDQNDHTRSGSFDINPELVKLGQNVIVFRVRSTNARNPRFDELFLTFNVAPAPTPSPDDVQVGTATVQLNQALQPLQACGGKINAFRSQKGEIVLRFRDVEKCSRISVLAANNRYLDLDTLRLIDNADGRTRSGDFTVDSSLIIPGVTNTIFFRLQSKNRDNPRFDVIELDISQRASHTRN